MALSPTDHWRAVILYGANGSTYKLALGTVLMPAATEGVTAISTHDLA